MQTIIYGHGVSQPLSYADINYDKTVRLAEIQN